jgi:hypothetical protein
MQGIFRSSIVLAVCLAHTPALSSSPTICTAFAEQMVKALPIVKDFTSALQNSNMSQASQTIDGDEKAALASLALKQRAAVDAMRAYGEELEDAAYILQKCARQ